MSLEHTTEKLASVSGPFIKWNSRKTVKIEARLPESCMNPCAYILSHELNLAQHTNLDSCYSCVHCILQVCITPIPPLQKHVHTKSTKALTPAPVTGTVAQSYTFCHIGG